MEIVWTVLAIVFFFPLKCQHINCGLFTLFEVTSNAAQETLYKLL